MEFEFAVECLYANFAQVHKQNHVFVGFFRVNEEVPSIEDCLVHMKNEASALGE